MRKEILYLQGEYCPDLELLKESMRRYCCEETFREEVLTYYYDEILQRWLDERGLDLILNEPSNQSDIECFKSLYQTIVGEPCSVNLECDFFKYAELTRVEINGRPYPIQSDGSITAMIGERLTFIFKPKRLGNERFVFVLKKEDKEFIEQYDFHPDSLYQEFSVCFHIKMIDFTPNPTVKLLIRQSEKDSVLCSILLGRIKLQHRYNSECYLWLYPLEDSPYYMSEVIKKNHELLERIFGAEYEQKLDSITAGNWYTSDLSQSEVVLMRDDYLWKNYSYQLQFPTEKQIEAFFGGLSKQTENNIIVRPRSMGNYPPNADAVANAEYVTCFSIHKQYIHI